jgi:hypothetical protein
MEQEEWESRDVCVLCGELVASDAQGFAFGIANVLCARCATARGGRYDAMRDVWEEKPDLSCLPDEAYGSAPHEPGAGIADGKRPMSHRTRQASNVANAQGDDGAAE